MDPNKTRLEDIDRIFAEDIEYHLRPQSFREHGQTWVECLDCGQTWSVVECEPGGIAFEEVSAGDDTCIQDAL